MTILKLAILTALGAAAFQDSKISNPEYEAWARCNPGSWVRMKSTCEETRKKTEGSVTVKLTAITSERAVLEVRPVRIVKGREMPDFVERREVPAKVAGGHRSDGSTFTVNSEGMEKVEANGRILDCRWADMTVECLGVRTLLKEWTSAEMVGGVVRTETSANGVFTTLHVTDWERK